MTIPNPAATAAREWSRAAVEKIRAEEAGNGPTPLHRLALPEHWGIDLYLKDETVHATGSLKHRLARSLFLSALCSGQLKEGGTVVEASSGSTAVSEAYFARLIGVSFIAVLPRGTSAEKIARIEEAGGSCRFSDHPELLCAEASALAAELGGHFMDQFTHAERVTDWRASTGLAGEILADLSDERYPEPLWAVMGAGTGGTSATLGRHFRYRGLGTRVCVVDPEGSAFYRAWTEGDPEATGVGSRIEGIGRPRVEASFIPGVIDRMERVPDGASIAAMRRLGGLLGTDPGGSSGTNLWGALHIVAEMRGRGERGSVVTVLCDGGERYRDTYYDEAWLARSGIDPGSFDAELGALLGIAG
ncbi:PLP-dependent cysteine synthase family protein [Mycetocola spongiae]|uniref:PLP-dependent cysteine synthase family protein n=1 Tax=Mycetocola spongiae TaxID=2859226 RepID=UPI001CF1EA00|nr:PLP-dependent cysteine synthase family protein [Mycetocola spongiae]UCR88168.1 PLP-dependent cysteine synthase family protein [Mycetocola spongiae]